MGFDQYHEPPEELSEETRTYVRVIQSLIEEAEAIDWYVQRLAVEKDEEARAVMSTAQKEEFIHFGIDLEFLFAAHAYLAEHYEKHSIQERRSDGTR